MPTFNENVVFITIPLPARPTL